MQQISLGKTLDVEVVEHELAALWQGAPGEATQKDQASADVEAESDTAVLRARAANLLVYVIDEESLAEVHELLPELTASHPSRVLTMFGDSNAPDRDIEMYVSAFSQQEKGAKRLCCEEVTMNARGSFLSELPSAALPLLVSDLPTFLWWRAAIDDQQKVLSSLLHESDRLIVDSMQFKKPVQELLAVNDIFKQDFGSSIGISDLNWARLTSWRGLLADFYDVPAYRDALDAIDKVRIEYVAPHSDANAIAPQALLMAGWLASRLQWLIADNKPVQTADQTVFRFFRPGQTIKVELQRISKTGIRPGRLARVRLHSNTKASFKVERSSDLQRVITAANLGSGVERGRVLPVRNRSTAQLLTREMEILCNDQIYQEALAVVAIVL